MDNKKFITAVFVDYENWFWNVYNNNANNDIDSIFNEIKKTSQIVHIVIYADFTQDFIKDEKSRLELKYPRMVHDCGAYNTNGDKTHIKKDLTDFYLLDDIYQTLFTNPRIEQFIIIAGDGHFHSVITHLRMFHEKKVGVFAIKGSLSPLIKNNSDWYVEVDPLFTHDFSKILSTLYNNEERKFVSYFNGVVTNCVNYFGTDRNETVSSLSYLINNEYVRQEQVVISGEGERKVLVAEWTKIEADDLWKRPNKLIQAVR